ncbi:flagellar assembly protein A [Gracilibacillus marinus]|uniref:Flagellar assembly protein A n=1 Tax=Gracilibacillus marinus TaxID=630535 RepID=A0ABV8VYC2_9BACI
MRQLISKGKSIEEAVSRGLELMNAQQNEVNVEVLQFEKSGIIGIGKKEAIVKLSKNDDGKDKVGQIDSLEDLVDKAIEESREEEYAEIEQINQTEDVWKHTEIGTAWIKDNQLFVKSKVNAYPTATINGDITFYRNHQLINKKNIVLNEEDTYKLEFEEMIEKPMSWKITIAKDQLEAVLELQPAETIHQKLKDVPPNDHIEIFLYQEKIVSNHLTREMIIEELEQQHITTGINEKAIQHAMEAKEYGRFVVAIGKEPEHGMDGELEVKIEMDSDKGLVEDEQGNVNFKEVNNIPNVDIGTILAIIHPPIEGIPGISVLGEAIQNKKGKALRVLPGIGVDFIEDKLIATESGRPVIEKRGKIVRASILSKLIHEGNVNLASGNIRFSGDVEIRGEVEENMIVEAGGDLYLYQSVANSEITAYKSIIAKGNIINSNIISGKQNLIVMELHQLLTTMEKQLRQMIVIIKQLTNAKAYKVKELHTKGLQPLIIILLEKKFQHFKEIAAKYVRIVNKADKFLDEPEWAKIAEDIKNIFLTLSNETITLQRLYILQDFIEEMTSQALEDAEDMTSVTLTNVTNSKVYSSGDITIIGKGCINSKIHASGTLQINGTLRGREVYGGLGVDVHEVGTIAGTKTIVATSPGHSIKIDKAYEGTIIRIGDKVKQIFDEMNYVTAKLDENEQITLF